MRLGILGAADGPYVLDLLRAGQELAHDAPANLSLEALSFNELQAVTGVDGLQPSAAEQMDAILVRGMPLGSLEQVIFRMDCLQRLEQQNVLVVNPPRTLETAIDKWLTLHRLESAGVPVPPTVACQTRTTAMEAWESLGGDVLVKPLFGGEGRGILRVQDKDLAWRVLGTLQQIGQVLYLQQFIEHFGYDVRVMFIGERVYAIRRYAKTGAWRTNLAQGSQAKPHVLGDAELTLASKAAAVVGGSVLGVDLLPGRDGRWWVLEVNAVPGWRGLGTALGLDVAAEIIRHVQQLVHGVGYADARHPYPSISRS